MARTVTSDEVLFHRPRFLPGIEAVSVRYRERSFPEHSHGEYVIGAVVAGAEALAVRGRSHRVDAGNSLRLAPDEAHANATLGAGPLRYHVLYIAADALAPLLDREGSGEDVRPALAFASPVSGDGTLFGAVVAAHAVLSDAASGRFEQEAALALLARTLARECRSGDAAAEAAPHPRGSAAVALARAYIDAHHVESFGLHDLAALTGLSVFHLVRSFKKSVGISPLAYRNQRRVSEARHRLLDGQPVAQVALDLGYADQSHLTRHFQRLVGISPRRYARQ